MFVSFFSMCIAIKIQGKELEDIIVINMLSFIFSFDDLLLIFCYVSKECFIKQYQFYKECRGMSMCPTEAYSFFSKYIRLFFFKILSTSHYSEQG